MLNGMAWGSLGPFPAHLVGRRALQGTGWPWGRARTCSGRGPRRWPQSCPAGGCGGGGSSYGGEGHTGSPLNPGGAVEGPGRAVQSVRCHASGSQGAPGLTSAETVLQVTCWGLPLAPDDPPSGPQLASSWPLAWHPLWGALGGQGRPLLIQATHRAPPAALREPALSGLCVCLGEGTPWNIPSW